MIILSDSAILSQLWALERFLQKCTRKYVQEFKSVHSSTDLNSKKLETVQMSFSRIFGLMNCSIIIKWKTTHWWKWIPTATISTWINPTNTIYRKVKFRKIHTVWFYVCKVQKHKWESNKEKQNPCGQLYVAGKERNAMQKGIQGFRSSGNVLFLKLIGGLHECSFYYSLNHTHIWFYYLYIWFK